MMRGILRRFTVEGEPLAFEELRGGHINRSYLAITDRGERYVLQRVNREVFPSVGAIMDNLRTLRDYLLRSGEPLPTICFIDTRDGAAFYEDAEGGVWRLYRYVDDCKTLTRSDGTMTTYECAYAFGRFQHALREFPAERLQETIPRFHDTPERYRQLREAAAHDPQDRLKAVGRELAFAMEREEKAGELRASRLSGELPLRVTHNDAKLSNVLLDRRSGKARCVIDLDTVMPGLAAYDFGDLIRSGASTGSGDGEENSLDPALFEAAARGFLSACPHLTPRERELLPLGAWTMTLECGVRFLADYLSGDRYFRISDPEQNLRRARSMFRLLADMEAKRELMYGIIDKLT